MIYYPKWDAGNKTLAKENPDNVTVKQKQRTIHKSKGKKNAEHREHMRTGKRDRNAEWRKDDNRSDVRVRNEQTNQQRVKALETGQCHGDRWSRCGRSVSVGRTVGVQVRRKYKVTSRCKRIRLQNKTGNQQGRSTMIVTWNNQNHKVRILCVSSLIWQIEVC